ncbi:hypothetical protein JNW90_10710 [Micromonospora sp. STR1s_5]|nr:hypothetical protein [Micromonospora sp. STR1s_5]
MAERLVAPPVTPQLGGQVHYVSYGTPAGEFLSTCRSAQVTAEGAWLDQDVEHTGNGTRSVHQRWDPTAAALHVANPTGTYFSTQVPQDPAGAGGTWHHPEWCPHRT